MSNEFRTVNDEIAETLRMLEREKVLMEEETMREKDAYDAAREPYQTRIKAFKSRLDELMQQNPNQGALPLEVVK